jgi:hypothetical protein
MMNILHDYFLLGESQRVTHNGLKRKLPAVGLGTLLLPVFAVGLPDPVAADDADLFVKDISKTPELASAKAKLAVMTAYAPRLKADGSAPLPGDDGYDPDNPMAQPIIVTYADEIAGTGGASDAFMAISRDDGATWKSYNLSKTAERSSFTLADETPYAGDSKKPVLQVKGNKALVAWTDKFCQAGSPRYSLGDEDLYGVAGSQRSIDYDADPQTAVHGLGEVPYSCVWTSRATVDPATGAIKIFKAERLTSGRRDANQIFVGAADGAGFAVTWQEDPDGLRPGEGAGPGHGFSDATTSKKTDIWYSYLTWGDFATEDPDDDSSGDPEQVSNEDGTTRVRGAVRLSMPVRISDNEMCNVDSTDGNPDSQSEDPDGDGTSHAYCAGYCAEVVHKVNAQGEDKYVCVTGDETIGMTNVLDGDTGASRPNLFLQKYVKNGVPSAWAILAYEETKGLGELEDACLLEDPDDPICNLYAGKDVYYHSFDFQKPDTVTQGRRLNLDYVGPDGGVIGVEPAEADVYYPADLTSPVGTLSYGARNLTENARRVRFILQGKGGIGLSRTILLALYKQGMDGKGRASDVMIRRMVAPASGNPYAFSGFQPGAFNMSSVAIGPDDIQEVVNDQGETVNRIVGWSYSPDNLHDQSYTNPNDDARAHRGQIRGDFVVMGYSHTKNWATARNANDKYDFYIRRSFDGGLTWTTDPDGSGVEHCQVVKEETQAGEGPTLACGTVEPGVHEPPRNVSLLPNNISRRGEPAAVGLAGQGVVRRGRGPAACHPGRRQDVRHLV